MVERSSDCVSQATGLKRNLGLFPLSSISVEQQAAPALQRATLYILRLLSPH